MFLERIWLNCIGFERGSARFNYTHTLDTHIKELSLPPFSMCSSPLLPKYNKRRDSICNIIYALDILNLVDIDEDLLMRSRYNAEPTLNDYIKQRDHKLTLQVYRGSIEASHESFTDVDLVFGIEIIEHLFPETLDNTPYNIFERIRPKVVALSTPNSDINGLFEMTTKFRHYDHKFEWSREQFLDWAINLCSRFTDYIVSIYGIGRGPEGQEELGCCSQMALFIRRDFWQLTEHSGGPAGDMDVTNRDSLNINMRRLMLQDDASGSPVSEPIYKLLYEFEIPAVLDHRSREERILDEGKYQLGFMRQQEEKYYSYETSMLEIPVQQVYDYLLGEKDFSIEEFKQILKDNSFVLNGRGCIELSPFNDDPSDEEGIADVYEVDNDAEQIVIHHVDDTDETGAWVTGDSTRAGLLAVSRNEPSPEMWD